MKNSNIQQSPLFTKNNMYGKNKSILPILNGINSVTSSKLYNSIKKCKRVARSKSFDIEKIILDKNNSSPEKKERKNTKEESDSWSDCSFECDKIVPVPLISPKKLSKFDGLTFQKGQNEDSFNKSYPGQTDWFDEENNVIVKPYCDTLTRISVERILKSNQTKPPLFRRSVSHKSNNISRRKKCPGDDHNLINQDYQEYNNSLVTTEDDIETLDEHLPGSNHTRLMMPYNRSLSFPLESVLNTENQEAVFEKSFLQSNTSSQSTLIAENDDANEEFWDTSDNSSDIDDQITKVDSMIPRNPELDFNNSKMMNNEDLSINPTSDNSTVPSDNFIQEKDVIKEQMVCKLDLYFLKSRKSYIDII